jgi:hypothetical protein
MVVATRSEENGKDPGAKRSGKKKSKKKRERISELLVHFCTSKQQSITSRDRGKQINKYIVLFVKITIDSNEIVNYSFLHITNYVLSLKAHAHHRRC